MGGSIRYVHFVFASLISAARDLTLSGRRARKKPAKGNVKRDVNVNQVDNDFLSLLSHYCISVHSRAQGQPQERWCQR
ncbi:hypothetical protein FIBSPDRAFT_554988 [Athelia psychrophila]|uniref:Uncharacterized protein n=1 Tax=Athelia psychrophila TaxID=1759441 RepID=A0A166IGF9_9AGAM|nr:hypothetical protein FIBSPDRAFT_554988 [Fibularhizoctonia sp. CBS 109695]